VKLFRLVAGLSLFGLAAVAAPGLASASSPGSFTFAAVGDFGANSNSTAVFSDINAANPNFLLGLGDYSYDQLQPSTSWCQYVRQNLGNVPFELVSGNHESDGTNGYLIDFANDNPASPNPQCFGDQMNSTLGPAGNALSSYGQNYYFDYPSGSRLARFIMISPGLTFNYPGYSSWSYDFSKGGAAYNWLSSAIDNARASGIQWVIVGMHKVCLTTGGSNCDIGTDLENLLISKHVDLVLQAHDHNYQRSKQLALNGGSCTGVDPSSYNPACVVNDGSSGTYQEGAGSVFVIDGTGGIDDEYGAIYNNPDSPYFATYMGTNVSPRKGFMEYSVSSSGISAQFVGATSTSNYTDSFTIQGSSSSSPTPTTTPTGTGQGSTVFSNNFDGQPVGSLQFGTGSNAFTGPGGSGGLTVQNGVSDSAPNALAATVTGGLDAYAYKTYSGSGYASHTLQFNVQLGSDFVLPSSEYMVLAQTLPNSSSNLGKVSLEMSSAGTLYLDYVDSAGAQHFLYSSASLQIGKWYSLALEEDVGAGTGALRLLVNGASVISASAIDTGSNPITYFAVGDEYTPVDAGTAGHLYIDDVVGYSTSQPGSSTPTPTPTSTTPTTTPTSTPAPPVPTLLFSNNFDLQPGGALQTGSGANQFTSATGNAKVGTSAAASPPNDLAIGLSPGNVADAVKQYGSSYGNHSLQFSFKLDNNFNLRRSPLQFADTTASGGSSPVVLQINPNREIDLSYTDAAGGRHLTQTGYTMPLGAWHTLTLAQVAGPSGSLTLSVDSTPVLKLTGLNLPTGGANSFGLGELSPSGKDTRGNVYFDDVVTTTLTAAPSPTPSPSPTTTPTTPTPTPTTPTPTPTTPTPTPTTPTPTATTPTPTPTNTASVFATGFDAQATGPLQLGSGPSSFSGATGSSQLTVQNTVFDSSPNALAVSVAGGGSAYASETYSGAGYGTHTLQFNIQLGSDFVLPSSEYLVLAQTLPNPASNNGKVDLNMTSTGSLFIDYWDASGTKHTIYTNGHLAVGGWHTIVLHQVMGSAGSISLTIDGVSQGGGTSLNMGSNGVTYFALGEEYTPNDTSTAGHLYLDDVTATSS